MATVKASMSSILGTVSTTATAAVTTIEAVTKSATMFSNFMDRALQVQQLETKKELALAEGRVKREATHELAEANREIANYCAKSTQHQQCYEAAKKEVDAFFSSTK